MSQYIICRTGKLKMEIFDLHQFYYEDVM